MATESAVINKWPTATIASEVDPHFLMLVECLFGRDVLFTKLTRRHRASVGSFEDKVRG